MADRQNYRILHFDADGAQIAATGRRGRGPGEFEDLIGLEFDPSGRLWAVDAGNGRYSVLSPGLDPVDTQPYAGFRAVPWTGRIDFDGVIHNPQVAFSPDGAQQLYVRSSPVDSLLIPPYTVRQQEVRTATGETRLVTVPYGRRPHWVMDRAGVLWFGDSGDGTLQRITYDGDTTSVITLPQRAVALTGQQRGEVVEAFQGGAGAAARVDSAWVPEKRPVFEGLAIDDRNRLWVTIPVEAGRVGYRIYGDDGRPIATAALAPSGGTPRRLAIGGDRVHAVVPDALGIPSITTYRVTR